MSPPTFVDLSLPQFLYVMDELGHMGPEAEMGSPLFQTCSFSFFFFFFNLDPRKRSLDLGQLWVLMTLSSL